MKNLIYVAHKMDFDTKDICKALKATTPDLDYVFIYPEDLSPNIENKQNRSPQFAKLIFETNKYAIKNSILVLAFVDKYPNEGRDSGVIWEIGFANGIGIPSVTATFNDTKQNQNIMIEHSSLIHFPSYECLLKGWLALISTRLLNI